MPLATGVLTESVPGDPRLLVVPDVVKRYQTLRTRVLPQVGAGVPAHFRDADFGDVVFAPTTAEVCAQADVVLCVQPPSSEAIAAMKPGMVLLGLAPPWSDADRVRQLMERLIIAFALELLPRSSRTQSMDALSSQAAVAGCECELIAADHNPKFCPTQAGRLAKAVAQCDALMAVAGADHKVWEMAQLLEEAGVEVVFAIQPVAGRMPGHMNVLLAEAGVPYDKIFDLEEIYGDFAQADVALVIGANTWSTRSRAPTSPARSTGCLSSQNVIVFKHGKGVGYSGFDNALFYKDNCRMLCGGAHAVIAEVITDVKALEA